jgi:hypothetical protein
MVEDLDQEKNLLISKEKGGYTHFVSPVSQKARLSLFACCLLPIVPLYPLFILIVLDLNL